MKQMLKTFCLGCLLLVCSCNKEEEVSLIPDYYWGEASALKNGEEWAALIYGICYGKDYPDLYGVLMDIYDEYGYKRERLTFGSLKKKRTGSFPVVADSLFKDQNNALNELAYSDSSSASHTTTIDDGDVLGDVYEVDQSQNNFIEILEYDESSGEVSGRFEVTFILTSEWTPNAPDTVRFTNGTFHTRIRDQLE